MAKIVAYDTNLMDSVKPFGGHQQHQQPQYFSSKHFLIVIWKAGWNKAYFILQKYYLASIKNYFLTLLLIYRERTVAAFANWYGLKIRFFLFITFFLLKIYIIYWESFFKFVFIIFNYRVVQLKEKKCINGSEMRYTLTVNKNDLISFPGKKCKGQIHSITLW